MMLARHNFHFKIGDKILAIICIPLIFEALFVLLLTLLLGQMDAQIKQEEDAVNSLSVIHRMGRLMFRGAQTRFGSYLTPGPLGNIDTTNAGKEIAKLKCLLQDNPAELRIVKKLQVDFQKYVQLMHTKQRIDTANENWQTLSHMPWAQEVILLTYRMHSYVQQLVLIEEKNADRSLDNLFNTKKMIELIITIGFATSIVITVGLSCFFILDIVLRIRHTTQNAKLLGARKPLLPSVSRYDELTELDKIITSADQQITSLEKARLHNLPLRTLWSWFRSYQKEGFSGLNRKGRSDKGQYRKISPEPETLIAEALLEAPSPPVTIIFQRIKVVCLQKKTTVPSYSTIYNAGKTKQRTILQAKPLKANRFPARVYTRFR